MIVTTSLTNVLGFYNIQVYTVINVTHIARSEMLQRIECTLPCIPWKNRTSVSKSPLQRPSDWSNLTYFLYGGSLLGLYRHHGMVPWDDDIDVLMNESERTRLDQHFKTIPEYTLYTLPNRQWKFYQNQNKTHTSC